MSASGGARRRRRSTIASTVILSLIAVLLTAFAVRYEGEQSSDMDVNNGGVWVSNQDRALIGRLNVDATEYDARLSMAGEDIDILQSGYHVFTIGPRGLSPVNTASVVRGGVVELPPESEVVLGGDRVAIATPDGRVWVLSPDQAAAFSPDAFKPAYEAKGSEVHVTVTRAGTAMVLDGDQLHTFPRSVDTQNPQQDKPITLGGLSSKPEDVALTAVGEEPVVLDRAKRQLRMGTEVRTADLSEAQVSDASTLVLQQPGDASDHVAVATENSLLMVPMRGGDIAVHPAGGTGTPATPAQVGGCAYGAWNAANRFARICEGHEPVIEAVPEAGPGADLRLRVNRDLVVLNDTVAGLSWMIRDSLKIVDQWVIEQEIQQDEQEEKEKEVVTSTITDVQEDRDQENRPPVAEDDEFGVRPGMNVVLPVTRNDSDPDGDVLLADLEGKQPSIGTVSPIRGGTQLQIAVDEDASGTATFTYIVDDGRGGTDTATVTLTVHPGEKNSPPEPAGQGIPRVQVLSGQTVTLNVLPYWEDPESDAFYLADATIQPEDLVTFRADGTVTVDDAGLKTGPKQVTLTFRDEHGATSESVLEVESVTDPELAPITTTDHLQVVAGRTGVLRPLLNDINPAGGSLELTHVDEAPGLEVDADLTSGSVRVSGEVGTYYLEYTASAREASSQGLIRVDVTEPDPEAMLPVAVDDMLMATTGGQSLLDPLENDVDPTGGVLVTNSVTVPEDSGVKATVVGHHLIRVEVEPGAAVSEEPVPLTYEVANAEGSSTGTVRVMLAATDTQFANPVPAPDEAVVRAGDMVLVDVLSNDISPTGSTLHLGEVSGTDGVESLGVVETHDQQIRFRAAPDAQGEATISYEAVDQTGRDGSSRLRVRIIPADAEDTPPQPQNLVARAVAGSPVRIPVPTTGIDAEGDSVMLMGISEPAPQLGEITSATGQWIEYVPYPDAVGTDTFRYQVMDASGAIGTAEVLVGVAAPPELNQPPYAVDDELDVRPGREIQIPVLMNDSDPEEDALQLLHDSVTPLTDIEVIPPAEGRSSDRITVMTPEEPGTHTLTYEVSDGQLTSAATVTLRVDPGAPLRDPIAVDDYVDPAQVLDPAGETITVDVLANDRDPDGSISDLTVRMEDGADGSLLSDDGILTVIPGEEQQRLRYTITDRDEQTSSGYVWVPGTARIPPVWVGGTLEVVSGSELSIDLADSSLVRVRPGAQHARVLDDDAAQADHTDGTPLVADETTLVYRPAEDYEGRDTITVEVSDGAAGDATAASGSLSIPIEVLSGETNQPPTLRGSLIEVESGGSATTVDLRSAAEDPDGDPLEFSVDDSVLPEGVSASISGSTLSVSAELDAPRGETIQLPVTVTDSVTAPVTETFQLTVTGSRRPKVSPGLDEPVIDAGTTGRVDVLENDSNPFPGEPLTLVDAQLVSGDGGVKLEGDQVIIEPDPEFAGILTASYTVEDATGDPERRASGEIRATVRGKPEAPSAPRVGEVGDGTVELTFTAGDDNGAPISGYTVTAASGGKVTQKCKSTTCTVTGLTNGTEYTFQVVAHNEVGDSPASSPSAPATPDVRPEPPGTPQVQRGDRQLQVSWSRPENRGSALQKYDVQRRDEGGRLETRSVDATSTELTWDELDNGHDYSFRVRAHNLSEEPSDWSGWSRPQHPAGPPKAVSGVEASRTNDRLGGGVTITWDKPDADVHNGEPISGYTIRASDGTTVTAGGDATSATMRNLDPDTGYTFTVTAKNSVGQGATSARSKEVVPWAIPEAPKDVKAQLPDGGTGAGPNGRAVVSWKRAQDNGTAIKDYVISWDGGSKTVDASTTSVTIDTLDNGSSYRFTVQARNRFKGGESAPSDPSNSVTPYTRPEAPIARGDNTPFICYSLNVCQTIVRVDKPTDLGGVPLKSITLHPGDVECNRTDLTEKTWATCNVAESTKYTMTVTVENEKGLVSEPTTVTFSTPSWNGGKPHVPINLTWKKGNKGTESYIVTIGDTDFPAVDYEFRTYHQGAWKSVGKSSGTFEISTTASGGSDFYVRAVDKNGNYSQTVAFQ